MSIDIEEFFPPPVKDPGGEDAKARDDPGYGEYAENGVAGGGELRVVAQLRRLQEDVREVMNDEDQCPAPARQLLFSKNTRVADP